MAGDRPADANPADSPRRQASLFETGRAVAWSFLGIRRKADYERDTARLNPVHVIAMGIAGAAVLILTLIMIARAVAG